MIIVSGKSKPYEYDSPKIDITGQRFGSLTAVSWAGFTSVGTAKKRRGVWNCICDCGNTVQVIHADLTQGNRKRCGFSCSIVSNKSKGIRLLNTGKPSAKTIEERKAAMRASYQKHREARIAYSKKYRETNPDRVKTNLKKWKENNPTYKKDKWATDMEFRLKEILRGRLYKAVREFVKGHSAAELVGCSIPELKAHLEAQFQSGMSWGNYGDWHIDHKKPIVLFNMLDMEQQKICFHYSNLQPLWKEDNLTKGVKYG